MAALLLLVGIIANKPKERLPWILLLLLVSSYTLRPAFIHFSQQGSTWSGWFVFVLVTVQRVLDAAAIIAVVRLRRIDRITNTKFEVAIILTAYAAVAIPFVAVPGWVAFDQISLSIAFGIVVPATYAIVIGLVAQLIFVDILRGRAFQFMIAAWLVNIMFDVIGHNVVELAHFRIGAAAFDVFTLSSFLWAAASLHPSMHEISRPATEVRADWSPIRSFTLVAAAFVPLLVSLLVSEASLIQRLIVVLFGCASLVLLIARARVAIAAYSRSEAALRHLSVTDSLTPLLNRRGLIERAATETRPLGTAYIDIDGFKLLNDAYGHEVGDRLLIMIAERLNSLNWPVLTAARVGADEFAVLFANVSAQSMHDTKVAVESVFNEGFPIIDPPVQVTASVGLAAEDWKKQSARKKWTTFKLAGRDLLDQIRKADIAQYYAKSAGGARARVFDQTMQDERIRQKQILDGLRAIGATRDFWLDYQAIVRIDDGHTVGAEALARMRLPGVGLISPREFIPLAEKYGEISKLGMWVFQSAIEQIESASDRFPSNFRISVNLSPQQLKSGDTLEHILSIMRRRPKIASRIRIEITESTFIDENSLAQIAQLQKVGYSIAIDDFGSEYASLQYLARLKVDVLKLDRSFTCRMATEARSRAIVKCAIELATSMGIAVIAEGVETDAERNLLAAMGCHMGQGYLWDRPATGLDRLLIPMPDNRESPTEIPVTA